MNILDNILFALLLIGAGVLFYLQIGKVRAAISLGLPADRSDRRSARLNRMLLVAFGQQKMFARPLPATLHAFVYIGFLVINVEVLEIVVDGIFGTHRFLSFLGPVYDLLMGVNEILALLVIVACIAFLVRRNIMQVKRFTGPEMSKYPRTDANVILWTEIALMSALFLFNISDLTRMQDDQQLAALMGVKKDIHGWFPVSGLLAGSFGHNPEWLSIIRELGWWVHIVGIFAFLNYIPRSKHFHIIMAFPNTYFSKLEPAGTLENVTFLTEEVKTMLDPAHQNTITPPERFGARDVTDLSWKALMDSWTCTECGRCTSVCPANITGKKLSPRKLIMDTRDRQEELTRAGVLTREAAQKSATENNRFLLGDYITTEELWACTTCNACTEACPVNIDHVSQIVEMRRYLSMEEANAPQEWNIMFNNLQNNGAPWAMPASARFDWADQIEMPAALVKAKA